LRTVAEHSGIGSRPRFTSESVDVVSTTRTIVSNPIIRFLISPYAINYHTEHHLYPSVPYFHLAKVNKLLRANPKFALRSHETKGYRQVINELTRRV
jgi:fatty acid desaturase